MKTESLNHYHLLRLICLRFPADFDMNLVSFDRFNHSLVKAALPVRHPDALLGVIRFEEILLPGLVGDDQPRGGVGVRLLLPPFLHVARHLTLSNVSGANIREVLQQLLARTENLVVPASEGGAQLKVDGCHMEGGQSLYTQNLQPQQCCHPSSRLRKQSDIVKM